MDRIPVRLQKLLRNIDLRDAGTGDDLRINVPFNKTGAKLHHCDEKAHRFKKKSSPLLARVSGENRSDYNVCIRKCGNNWEI
jgi:hypothetical protein